MVRQLFLARPLSNRLEALGFFPDRKAADGLEPRFMARLDRVSNQLARIGRSGRTELESFALFVRSMPAIDAPFAEGDEAVRGAGRGPFQAFARVARVASRRPPFHPEGER
jgi:hypothetical protein